MAQAPGSVLFEDDFSSDTGAWTLPSGDYGSAFYEDGWLHVRDNPGVSACGSELTRDFADFVVEVDTMLVDGTGDSWHRVDARYHETDNYYGFAMKSEGTYGIFLVEEAGVTKLAGGSSVHINRGQGATNHMRVECVGSRLSLSVNGHLLAEVTDSSYATGLLALGCDASPCTEPSEVAFDNLVISAP